MVGPDFFKTVGIPMLAGRDFTRSDVIGAPKVAIVNEAFAKKFNLGAQPGRPAHGKAATRGKLDIEIIGLVKDAKYSEVKKPRAAAVASRRTGRTNASDGLVFYVATVWIAGHGAWPPSAR